jgi:DNA-binding CsgD family transcriptional regulator
MSQLYLFPDVLARASLSVDDLTRRQRDVLDLIIQGKSNKEIARILGLGVGTVKIHVAALFRKLRVNRRAAVAVVGDQLILQGVSTRFV